MGAMIRTFEDQGEKLDKIFLNKPPCPIHLAPLGVRELPEWA